MKLRRRENEKVPLIINLMVCLSAAIATVNPTSLICSPADSDWLMSRLPHECQQFSDQGSKWSRIPLSSSVSEDRNGPRVYYKTMSQKLTPEPGSKSTAARSVHFTTSLPAGGELSPRFVWHPFHLYSYNLSE